MQLSQNLLDKINKSVKDIEYGKVVLNISPKDITVEVITRMSIDIDREQQAMKSPERKSL